MSPARLGGRLALAGAAFTLAYPLVLYPALLQAIASARRRAPGLNHAPGAAMPALAVVLAVYNERSQIRPRLENLAACSYPRDRLQLLVIDGASSDGTPEIAEAFAADHPALDVRVIREEERRGKAAALNLAIRSTDSDLLLVTDALTRFPVDGLERMVAALNDPRVGAVTGSFDVPNAAGALGREEAEFWRVRNLLRARESAVDSTPFLSGEMYCFRRTAVQSIDEDTMADDMNVPLRLRRQGHRAVVAEGARFAEPRSGQLRELFAAKARRAAGGVQELLRARDMIGNARYGLFGTLILPSAFFTYLPLRTPAALVLARAALARFASLPWPLRTATALAAVAVAVSRRRQLTERAVLLGFNEAVFIAGWYQVLAGKLTVQWAREESTREAAEAELPWM